MDRQIGQLRRFVKTGDAEAFSEIVQRHAGLVYAACLRVLADRDRAADATQETFLQLLRDAGTISGSVGSWLHRVATRKAINMVHRDSSRRRREAKYAADKPLQTSRWEDISKCIDDGLDELDDEMREILIKYFFEGRTTVDIATEKGISQPTVSRRIEVGLADLREKLRKRGIIVAAAALGSLLTQNAAEAAPVLVLKELGKIAIVGAKAAAASGVGATATTSGLGAKAAVSGVLTGLKGKIITVASVAAIGVGGVVTYKHVTAPDEQRELRQPVAEPVARPVWNPRPEGNVHRQQLLLDKRKVRLPEETRLDTDKIETKEHVETSKPVEPQDSPSASDSDDSDSAADAGAWVPYAGGGIFGAIGGEPGEHEEPDRPEKPDQAPDGNKPPEPHEHD
ncbi:MAG: RNA polymerase sigma factor [Planctomycetota bacterium]|jgi:RNA polymerase sigma-70 factor (ECF subfamily)